MFVNPTVFVLGAGASWHYGYPTGEGLVADVIELSENVADYCGSRIASGFTTQAVPKLIDSRWNKAHGTPGAVGAWEQTKQECRALAERLRTVRPLVIDYFLGWNPSLQTIGKIMIAAAILRSESIYASERANVNRHKQLEAMPLLPSIDQRREHNIRKYGDAWVRFVTHKLVYGITKSDDLLKNKVTFITFNYDGSLENELHRSLRSIDLFRAQHVDAFLNEKRVLHVYGSVHKNIPQESPPIDRTAISMLTQPIQQTGDLPARLDTVSKFLNRCLDASSLIRTIDPDDKDHQPVLGAASRVIEEAKVIYILGYSFDDNNNRRIGLQPHLDMTQSPAKVVMFTNFGDINIVNKRASKLLFHRYQTLVDKSVIESFARGSLTAISYVEKSVRNVYDALEMDFASFESDLLGDTPI